MRYLDMFLSKASWIVVVMTLKVKNLLYLKEIQQQIVSFDKSLKTMVEMQNHAGKFYLFNFADL